MTHVRATLRLAIHDALAAGISEITWDKRWWRRGTSGQLPRGAVGINRSSDQRADRTTAARENQILVVAQISGDDDIGDDIDALSAKIETTVLAVLDDQAALYGLVDTQISVDDEASRPTGELVMYFTATLWTEFGDPENLEA